MQNFIRAVTILLTDIAVVHCRLILNDGSSNSEMSMDKNVWENYIIDIYKERPFNDMLILRDSHSQYSALNAIYQFGVPKVCLSANHGFEYKGLFNKEILAVVVMCESADKDLMETTAYTLEHIRQTRILILALDIKHPIHFQNTILQLCELYKMTNVLLHLLYTKKKSVLNFHMLRPYPEYHWSLENSTCRDTSYFPPHWLNLHNKTLRTLTDQMLGRSLAYKDSEGNVQLNGFVSRFILLFAERINASLKYILPVVPGNPTHFTVVLKMVKDGKLDLPMALDADAGEYTTYYLDLGQIFVMVPCALPLTTREVFSNILSLNFFGCIFVTSLVLTTAYSGIDYSYYGQLHRLNLMIDDKVFPGILGQSFAARVSHLVSLRIVYILIGLAGINISSQFAGHLNTLLTSPPRHRQIETIDDLKRSPVRILMGTAALEGFKNNITHLEGALTFTNNSTYLEHRRRTFNTTYAYFATSALWNLFSQEQQFYSHKSFCTNPNLTLLPLLPWGVRVPPNSPLKEAMNALIHRVHDVGLIYAWQSSTFTDMMKAKMFLLRDPKPHNDRKALSAYDLYWIWILFIVCLGCSCLVFVAELFIGSRTMWLRNCMQWTKTQHFVNVKCHICTYKPSTIY